MNLECLICKKTRQKLFNINYLCGGDSQNTIKDDIIEFLGESIAPYLHDNHHVCNICMNMLDYIVKSKLKILDAILAQNEQKYIPNFGRCWNIIARSYERQFKQDPYIEPMTPSLTPNTPPLPSSRNPTPLVYVSRTAFYNENLEKNAARREGIKTELKSNYSNASSRSMGITADWRNKEKKKNVRSKSADVKILKNKICEIKRSEQLNRSISVASEISCVSYTGEDCKAKEPTLLYDDEIKLPLKRPRTRSVSRVLERNMQYMHDKEKQIKRKKLFQCPYPECKNDNFKESLNLFTSHFIVIHHRTQPGYRCAVCGNAFFNSAHLNMHQQVHDTIPVLCGVCGKKQLNVSTYQRHIDQHLTQSFKCFRCDIAFLTKQECNEHIFSNHKQKKVYDKLEQRVLKQVNYAKPNASDLSQAGSSTGGKKYQCIQMDQSITRDVTLQEPFRPLSFPEVAYLYLERLDKPDEEREKYIRQLKCGLGDDLTVNKNMEDSLGVERKTPPIPRPMLKEDESVHDWKTTNFRIKGKRGCLTRNSDRLTPLERSNTPSDDEQIEIDMPSFSSLTSRRELESRNTEVSYFLGKSEAGAESVGELGERSQLYDSDKEANTNVEDDSDVDSEMHYLDGDSFVPSINLESIYERS